LQTISTVQDLIGARIANMGSTGMQTVQARLNAAQSELAKLRNRFPGGGDATDIPDFRPQQVKTSPVKRRLVYGFDMNCTRPNALIPTYTDFGVSVGYKALDKLTVFLGGSYKVGWGRSIQHISLSSQGISIRMSVDYKIKRSYYLSAGAEANYLNAFKSIKELQSYSAWVPAALVGISKTVSLKSRVLKNTKLAILFNALYAKTPKTSPVVVRAGYIF